MNQLIFLLVGLWLASSAYANINVTSDQMALLYQKQEEGQVSPEPDIGDGKYTTLTDQIRALEASKNGKEPKIISVPDQQEIDLNDPMSAERKSETPPSNTVEQEIRTLKERIRTLEEKVLRTPHSSQHLANSKSAIREEATLEAEANSPVLAISSNAHGLYDEGLAMMQEGKYMQATQTFKKLTNEYPEDPYQALAQIKIAECDMGEGNYKNALESFEKAYALNREHTSRLSSIRLNQADIYQRLNKIEEVKDRLKDVNPKDLTDNRQLELYNSLKNKVNS